MKPVRDWTDADHKEVLARIDQLVDSDGNTSDPLKLEELAKAVDTYERARFPQAKRTPINYLQHFLDKLKSRK